MENFILFILFLAVLGLCCCAGPSLVAANKDHSLGVVRGCLVTEVSLIVDHGLSGSQASVVAAGCSSEL